MKRTPTFAAVILLLLLALLGGREWLGTGGNPQPQTTSAAPDSGAAASALAGFPAEERSAVMATLALIERGGPFPYSKDGSVFSNREGRLPSRASGYYREYTVETPNSPDRGARRIVTGDGGEVYYTRDHYDSFVQLK
ncbi:MAG TPA: ribonuclease domain-containing protein [Dongiaceae bacterium]|jgi:ribonuclease T1